MKGGIHYVRMPWQTSLCLCAFVPYLPEHPQYKMMNISKWIELLWWPEAAARAQQQNATNDRCFELVLVQVLRKAAQLPLFDKAHLFKQLLMTISLSTTANGGIVRDDVGPVDWEHLGTEMSLSLGIFQKHSPQASVIASAWRSKAPEQPPKKMPCPAQRSPYCILPTNWKITEQKAQN